MCPLFFIFSPNDSHSETFHLKSSFRFRDNQIFVFPSSFLFLPVGHHCFRAYDIINCLNKNLITHFVWYLEEEQGMTLKLCPYIDFWIRNIFMEKIMQKMCTKTNPRHFCFGKERKTAISCKKFSSKWDILKEDYQKALKNLILFFLSNPVPFNGQNYQKQKELETSDQSLFRLRTKQVQENSFLSYVLSDPVCWCNIKRLLSYSKNYIFKFMLANSWHHKLCHFHLSIWI